MSRRVAIAVTLVVSTWSFNVQSADSSDPTSKRPQTSAQGGEQERGPWPTQFPTGRFLPSQLKYFEEQEKQRTAEKPAAKQDAASQGSNQERGPWPALFPAGRFLPPQLKYFEEQERALKANPPTRDLLAPFPGPSLWTSD